MEKFKKVLGVMIYKEGEQFAVVKNKDVYFINEVGARILELCDGINCLDDIVNKISKYYKMDDIQVKNDVSTYTQQLIDMQLIKKV